LETASTRTPVPIAGDFVPSPDPAHRAWPLDLLRILAALFVLVQHWSIVGLSEVANSDFLRAAFSYGYLGVDVFFFISGIVITRSALSSDARRFTVARFARLAPAYLVILLISIPVGLYTKDARYEISSIFSSLSFSEFVTQPEADDLLILDSWTLWVEIQFYFLIAIVLLLFGLWQILARTHSKITLSIFKVLFSVWLAFIALNLAGDSGIPVLLTLGGFATAFICGGLFGTITNWNSLLRLSPILFLATTLMFYGFYERSLNSMGTFGSLDLQTSRVLVAAFLVVLCLFAVLSGLVAGPLPARSAKIVTIAALATYPLYLMHQELGNRSILKMTELGVPVALSVIATFTWCVALSIFISMKIEPPMRAAILRFGSSAPSKKVR
jgi:peptidoglycan/LPS O-acetylase OafA/YrhL